jgi:hypothetical protein
VRPPPLDQQFGYQLIGTKLVVPKFHGEKLIDIPDDQLSEILVCTNTNLWRRGNAETEIASCKEACQSNWSRELQRPAK